MLCYDYSLKFVQYFDDLLAFNGKMGEDLTYDFSLWCDYDENILDVS